VYRRCPARHSVWPFSRRNARPLALPGMTRLALGFRPGQVSHAVALSQSYGCCLLATSRGQCLPSTSCGRCLPSTSCSHRRRATTFGELYTLPLFSRIARRCCAALMKPHVADVCFNSFRGMLQVLHMDVAKVDRDVAHVAYVASVFDECCKFIVPNVSAVFRRVLHLFYLGVAYVSHICCKCFIRMLHMFHTYVARVSSECCICFAMTTHMFSWCFRRMLQVFQLFWTYVASVSSRCCKSRSGVAHVAVEPICNSRLLQLLGPLVCAWV
jgi:hypothetical protein